MKAISRTLCRLCNWRRAGLASGALAVLLGSTLPAAAQQTRARDSVPLRADFRDLNELLAKLPKTAPPPFGESQAVALGAIQLSCIDRLQPMIPPERVPRDTTADSVTTESKDRVSHRSVAVERDSAGARGSASSPVANDRGTGYFWTTTYSLVPSNNQTRAFWGCSDWHSAVSSTWATVNMTRHFPNSPLQELSREKLADHLGASNLQGELEFFHSAARSINPIPFSAQRGLFERPYGFAWLLKLQSELYTWSDSSARKWSSNASPLANWMSDSLSAYIAELPQPARGANQSNTAFSLMLALDYASAAGDTPLYRQITSSARRFYTNDKACKTESEASAGAPSRAARANGSARPAAPPPDTGSNDLTAHGAPPAAGRMPGGDVISPCLTEAALMSAVLPQSAFVTWLNAFLPPMQSGRFSPLTEPAGGDKPVAAADSARFSGLSFERAQAMERIARALPANDQRTDVLRRLSAIHAVRGFELMRGDVSGISWLPAYALLYIDARQAR